MRGFRQNRQRLALHAELTALAIPVNRELLVSILTCDNPAELSVLLGRDDVVKVAKAAGIRTED